MRRATDRLERGGRQRFRPVRKMRRHRMRIEIRSHEEKSRTAAARLNPPLCSCKAPGVPNLQPAPSPPTGERNRSALTPPHAAPLTCGAPPHPPRHSPQKNQISMPPARPSTWRRRPNFIRPPSLVPLRGQAHLQSFNPQPSTFTGGVPRAARTQLPVPVHRLPLTGFTGTPSRALGFQILPPSDSLPVSSRAMRPHPAKAKLSWSQ